MSHEGSEIDVALTLNGRKVAMRVPAMERLLDTLRYRLGLTGSKEGCGEGECGACTVYLDGLPVCSCLVPTFQCGGREVKTIAAMFPGSGGALYGAATRGWTDSLTRHAARTKLAGLYLAGGSVHPGAGVPMATLSGRYAARSVCEDLASIGRWRPAGTAGGTSTRSATTAATD